jgi:alpha-L-rhamnosidase
MPNTKSLFLSWVLLFAFSVCRSQPQPSINPDLLRHEWEAQWIGPRLLPGESDHGVFHFRHSIDLPSKPASFIVHVTADNRYRLFVNGKAVGLGPARGDKVHWHYETYDLAPYLKAGDNLLAAQVWNLGGKGPAAQMTIGKTAFLMQGNTEKESAVNTNTEEWKVVRDDAFRPKPVTGEMVFGYYALGNTDSVYAARYPWGWEGSAFDDKSWEKPAFVSLADPLYFAYQHGEADGGLTPRMIPMMEEKVERIPKVVRASGINTDEKFLTGKNPLVVPPNTRATILLDQTHLTTAYPEFWVSGGKGSSVTIAYAEALYDEARKKGNRNETENKRLYGYEDVFIPDGGENRMFRPLWYRTFRFVELRIKTGAAPLAVNDFYGVFTAYPFKQKASFASSDPGLQDIWEVGWRTARLCANETYYDCPYYEQLQYVGDTRIQALISLYVTGDDRLMRNALTLFDQSRLPEGLTQSRYPSEILQMIPPFSLFWVDMVHDYYRFRDDPAFVKKFLPGIRATLSWYEDHLDDKNLLSEMGWWNFVDWADEFERGVPEGAEEKDGTSIISLQLVYALDRAAELFGSFNLKGEAARYRDEANTIRNAVYVTCYDKQRSLFSDSPQKKSYSQHANVLAILTDAIPAGEQPALMKRILSDTTLTQCSLYFRFYLVKALKKAGMADAYLDNIGAWKDMLAQGLTTFPEQTDNPRSDCHAWSSSPMIEFLATVCGVEPAAPGFKKVKIEPHLGPLKEAQGVIPHPLGSIEVRMKRKGRDGITAEITLPQGLTGNFVWNGATVPLKAGKQVVER